MYRKIKTRFFAMTISGLVAAAMLLTPEFSQGAGSESRRAGGPAIIIDEDRPVHPGYPTGFDKLGRIDRLAEREMVIGDKLYRLSPAVTFHTPALSNASRSRFRKGAVVGCLMNSDGEIESIWLIRDRER